MGQLKRSKKYAKKMGEAYTGRPARSDAKVANPEMAGTIKSKRTKLLECGNSVGFSLLSIAEQNGLKVKGAKRE